MIDVAQMDPYKVSSDKQNEKTTDVGHMSRGKLPPDAELFVISRIAAKNITRN